MRIEVPQSLFETIRGLAKSRGVPDEGDEQLLMFRGPFGEYEIFGKPDEDYCEKVVKEVLRYRE